MSPPPRTNPYRQLFLLLLLLLSPRIRAPVCHFEAGHLSLSLFSIIFTSLFFFSGKRKCLWVWPEGLQELEAWVCCKSFSNSPCEDRRRRRRHETRIPRRKGIGGVGSKKTQVLKGEEPAIAPPLQKSKI